MAFGLAHLSQHLERDPDFRPRLADSVRRRHDALRHTAGLNDDVFDASRLQSYLVALRKRASAEATRNLYHAPHWPSLLGRCLGANFELEADMARVLTGESVSVLIDSEDDLVAAREEGRALASKLRLSSTDIVRIATVISELARNVLVHARRGEIHFRAIDDGRKRGIVITAKDEGPGIERPDRAMQDGYSTSGGFGLGLPGVRRLMDEFRLESTAAGTTVTVTKWSQW